MNLDPETKALLERVRLGNEKLIAVWPKIIKIADGQEFAEKQVAFYKAVDKLNELVRSLVDRGYHDCLYIENGVKTKGCYGWPDSQLCKACPSDKDYYVSELFGGDPPVNKLSVRTGPNWVDFCKTLGGKI